MMRHKSTLMTLALLQFLCSDQAKAVIILKPITNKENVEHHQANILLNNPTAVKLTPVEFLIVNPSITRHDYQVGLLPQASSSMYKTTVHSNLKHVITKDNLKLSVIMKTTEHSHANIVHPIANQNSHAKTNAIKNVVDRDATSKKSNFYVINENLQDIRANNLMLKHHTLTQSPPLIIINHNHVQNHLGLQKPVVIADNNINSVHLNTMIKGLSRNLLDNHIRILNNRKEITKDFDKVIVAGTNPAHLEKLAKVDSKKENLKIRDFSISQHNDGSEEIGDYKENYFRNPVGGFGVGIHYGGHGAGHGYFGYYG